MFYKTEEELEKLTPEELIQERKLLAAARKRLLDEAERFRDYHRALILELNSRLTLLELDLLEAEQDRIAGGREKYDHLCRIH